MARDNTEGARLSLRLGEDEMRPRLKTLAEARLCFVRSLLPEEKHKDTEYLAEKKAGDFKDNLDAAYHEGFVDGYNQCREDILKKIREEEQ